MTTPFRSRKESQFGSQPRIGRGVEPEIEFYCPSRLEPGQYPAYCRSANTYHDHQFKRWVCAVQFDILSDSLLEVLARVTRYLNLGKRGEVSDTAVKPSDFHWSSLTMPSAKW
jgi:hypothetical protein